MKEGIFQDNVHDHTLRCIGVLENLPLPEKFKERVRQYLLIHDLPAIQTGNFTTVEKEGSVLARELGAAEQMAANNLLSENDQILLAKFSAAGNLFEGKNIARLPPTKAVIAKMIDTFENSIYFHVQLAKWIGSEKYDPRKLPRQQPFDYTFRHCPEQIGRIKDSPYDQKLVDLAVTLLEGQINVIGMNLD